MPSLVSAARWLLGSFAWGYAPHFLTGIITVMVGNNPGNNQEESQAKITSHLLLSVLKPFVLTNRCSFWEISMENGVYQDVNTFPRESLISNEILI